MRKVRDHKIAMSETEDDEAEKAQVQLDPIQEAEQFFDQQMQLLEKSFDMLAEEPGEAQIPDMHEDSFMDSVMISKAVDTRPFNNRAVK